MTRVGALAVVLTALAGVVTGIAAVWFEGCEDQGTTTIVAFVVAAGLAVAALVQARTAEGSATDAWVTGACWRAAALLVAVLAFGLIASSGIGCGD